MSSISFTKALRICEVAFIAFVDDTKDLVARGVRANISHINATAGSRKELSQVSKRGAIREAKLKTWLKFPHPLYYGHDEEADVFDALLDAISAEEDDVVVGLPNFQHFKTTPESLAKLLFDISKPSGPSSCKAPVLRKGSFLPVLKVAHKSLLSLADRQDIDNKEKFVISSFKLSFRTFKIHFFPSPSIKTTVGAPTTKPLYDSWGYLGSLGTTPIAGSSQTSHAAVLPPTTVAYNNVVADDFNMEWRANALDMKTLKRFVNKTTLPIDFSPPSPSVTPYVDDTYRWVRENYDGTKPLHHLALLVSIIVASSFIPYLFPPAEKKGLFINARTPEDVRKVYDALDWEERKKNGLKDKSIFIAMYTTLIIALYEKESPLRMHMEAAPKGGLGNPWTDKHCQSLSPIFSPFRFNICSFFLLFF